MEIRRPETPVSFYAFFSEQDILMPPEKEV